MPRVAISKSLKLYLYIVFLWALAVAFSILLRRSWWWRYSPTLLESVYLLIFYLLLFAMAPLRKFMASLPKPHAIFITCFLFAFSFFHVVRFDRATFPFLAWEMYGGPLKGKVLFYQFEGQTRQGRKVYLTPDRFFSAMLSHRLYFGLHYLTLGTFDSKKTPPDLQKKIQRIEATAQAIAQIYNQKNPEDPVVDVRILRATLGELEGRKRPVIQESVHQFKIQAGSL